MIIEVLINIKRYVHLTAEDTIYFVTGNYRDFSLNKINKEVFHPHIAEDLTVANIFDQVRYVNNFSKLVSQELEDEIKNAELQSQFEEIEREAYFYDNEDNVREAAGLPSLSSFQDMLEEQVRECDDSQKIINLFSEINETFNDLENYYNIYDDEISIWLSDLSEKQQCNVIKIFNSFFSEYHIESHPQQIPLSRTSHYE